MIGLRTSPECGVRSGPDSTGHRDGSREPGPREPPRSTSTAPRARVARPGPAWVVSANGRSVPRCARRAEPQQVLRECPMTPLRLPSSAAAAACRLSDSGREHGFGAPRLPALRFVRTASGSAPPRPRLQRHAPRLGGFIRDRGAPRSPRGHKNPRGSRLAVCSMGLHRIRCGSSCQWRGVCPRHRDCGDSGTGLRPFRRPRRRQPTTLPLAARWMAALYHAVTRAARAAFLAIALPPLGARPILPPVTTRSAPIRPLRRPGSDRRHAASSCIRTRSGRTTRVAHRAGRGPSHRSAPVARGASSPRHRREARRRSGKRARGSPRGVLTGAATGIAP